MFQNDKGSSKAKCPICGKMRTKLADHAIRIHNMNPVVAKGLRSQTGQNHRSRQPAKRKSQRFLCSVTGCSKAVKKPHNHLKDTHGIKDNILYRKLLRQMVPFKDVAIRTESEETEEDDKEQERRAMKKILKKSRKYLKRVEEANDESICSSDEDWLHGRVKELYKEKIGWFISIP